MSGQVPVDNLDEEFERIQRELTAIAASVQQKETSTGNQEKYQVPDNNSGEASASKHKGAVIVAADDAVTSVPRPAWQRELLERDMLQLQATAALRNGSADAKEDTKTDARVEAKAEDHSHPANDAHQQSSSATLSTASHASAQGHWKWDGTRWKWISSEQSSTLPLTAQHAEVPLASSAHAVNDTSLNKNSSVAGPSSAMQVERRRRGPKRMAAGEVWVDETLSEWPENDFRIFVGDLAPDATEKELADAFGRYKSFNMARIVQDKKSGKCRGYGFVSFAAGEDMVAALKEMNGKYVGNRPVKLKRSNWKRRNLTGSRKKELRLFRSIVKEKK